MESIKNDCYRDGLTLYNEIISKQTVEKLYIILDEVQFIKGWERVVNSLRVDIDCDIYVAGSNAYLLSTEISTLLRVAMWKSVYCHCLSKNFVPFKEIRTIYSNYIANMCILGGCRSFVHSMMTIQFFSVSMR